jgi:hypothetical protein
MVIGVAHLQPIVAMLAGILILLVPRILNYVIAIYLIITGLIGLGLIHAPNSLELSARWDLGAAGIRGGCQPAVQFVVDQLVDVETGAF